MIKNKQSGFAHIMTITVVVTVALVGALGFIFWQNFMQPKTKSSTTSNSAVNTNTTPVTETNVTDSAIVNKLSNNVKYLSARHPTYPFPIDGLYQKQVINAADVSGIRKLHVALDSLYYDSDFSTIPINQTMSVNNYKDEVSQSRSSLKMVSYSTVSDRYTKLFGGELSLHTDILLSTNSVSTPCPAFLYDSSNRVYYSYPMCGGAGGNDYAYNYKYSRKDNIFFVYTSHGGETINASNYNEFSKFKWTFSKNSNDEYHFVSVEKVNG